MSTPCDFSSSSSPDSSSEDGLDGRRAGGSLSPGLMIRVGGGGSLLEPSGLRSLAAQSFPLELSGIRRDCGRAGSGGGGTGFLASEFCGRSPRIGETERRGRGGRMAWPTRVVRTKGGLESLS